MSSPFTPVRRPRGGCPSRGDPAGGRWRENRRCGMAEFGEEDLSGSTFDWTDLSGSTFRAASLSNVTIRGTDLHHVKMTGVELWDVDISGEISGLRINGVDVTAYVEEELAAASPTGPRCTPTTPPASARLGTCSSGSGTAPSSGPGALTRRSCTSRSTGSGRSSRRCGTSRSRPPRGSAARSSATRPRGTRSTCHGTRRPRTRASRATARPGRPWTRSSSSAATRQAEVRRVVEGLTEETLAAETTPPDDDGWPPARPFPVKECLSIVLNEEWWHRPYAERDLAILEKR